MSNAGRSENPAYRAKLRNARAEADERASRLNHKAAVMPPGQPREDCLVMAAAASGQGNAYSKALTWLDELGEGDHAPALTAMERE
jgi:hypothetical protein